MSEANIYVDRVVILPVYQGPDISSEERETKLKLVHGQTKEIIKHEHGANVPKVTCPGCGRKLKIMWMYRCLYCSIYFCKECAEHHFGASVPKSPVGTYMVETTDATTGSELLGDNWWCPNCQQPVLPQHVTYEETHDTRAGGCGCHVLPEVPVDTF